MPAPTKKRVSSAPRRPSSAPPSRSPICVADALDALGRFIPPFLRDPDDPPVLAYGRAGQPVSRAVIALDADLPAVQFAHRLEADLLLAHHPPFFAPPASLADDGEAGLRAQAYARANLSVAALHGAFDMAPGGIADLWASGLGLKSAETVWPVLREPWLKLAVFVPETHYEAVRLALAEAGAGRLGPYSECSFSVSGEGVFRPGRDARPFSGKRGWLERTPERRVEAVLPARLERSVESALRRAHPYETPAYDFCVLRMEQTHGYGRRGDLARPASLVSLAGRAARFAREAGGFADPLRARWCAPGHAPNRLLRDVVVWPGGGLPIGALRRPLPDAVVAGEIKYHDLAGLRALGVGVVLLGHAESEWPGVPALAKMARAAWPDVTVTAMPPPRLAEGWTVSRNDPSR